MAMPEKLTYEERIAWPAIRKLLQRRPEVAAQLLEGLSQEMAVSTLLRVRDELTRMLEVSRAFSAACAALAKKEKPNEPSQPDC